MIPCDSTVLEEKGCIYCKNSVSVLSEKIFDTRFGIDCLYQIGVCKQCGLQQTYPIPKLDTLKTFYQTFYNFGGEGDTFYTRLRERFLYSSIYRFWLAIDGDVSFHRIKGSGRLMDIGCNEGRGLEFYHRNGFVAEGLELNEEAAAVAQARGFRIYMQPIEDFEFTIPYDVAVLSNVLEHSLDPKEMLAHVRRILKSNGSVWISCPNNESWLRFLFGRYWINWHVPFHIIHFSAGTLRLLLESSGFKNIRIRYETPALWVAHSLISKLFAQPGKPTHQLRSPFLIAFLILVIRFIFFPWLWLGDRIGRGDCLVVIAQKDSI